MSRGDDKGVFLAAAIPIIGAICCAFLVDPRTGRNPVQYSIAGVLTAVGIVSW